MPRVRLKDIAARLGVTTATVSMALRNHPRIAAQTRDRIQGCAREMGYTPDPGLRRLADARWGQVGERPAYSMAIVTHGQRDYPRLLAEAIPALEGAAKGLGYGVERVCISDYSAWRVCARILRARGVRGLFLLPAQQLGAYQAIQGEDWSMVQVFTGQDHIHGLPQIRHDPLGDLLDASEKVLQRRPRSAAIALVAQPAPSVTDLRYLSAAHWALARWQSAGIAAQLWDCPTEGILETLADRLRAQPPEILVVATGGLLYEAWRRGLRIPEAMEVISLAITPGDFSDFPDPWSGYRKDFQAVAQVAARALDSQIRHGLSARQAGEQTIVVPSIWDVGATFRAVGAESLRGG